MIPLDFKGSIKVQETADGFLKGRVIKSEFVGARGFIHKSAWETYWEPNALELAAIIKGAAVRLRVYGGSHPTVGIDVKEVPK